MARGTPSQPPLRSEGTRRRVGASSWKIHGGSMLRLATASPAGHHDGACFAVSSSVSRRWCTLSEQHEAWRLWQQHQAPAGAMPAAEETGDDMRNRPDLKRGDVDARAQRACSSSRAVRWNVARTAHAPARNGRVPHAPAATPPLGRHAARGAQALPPSRERAAAQRLGERAAKQPRLQSRMFAQLTAASGSLSEEGRKRLAGVQGGAARAQTRANP